MIFIFIQYTRSTILTFDKTNCTRTFFFFFSSPTIAKRTDSGENHINENKAGST